MPLIDLETDTLHASAADTLEVSQTISTAVTTLQSALAGTASMAGDDDGAQDWIKGQRHSLKTCSFSVSCATS